MNIFLLLLGVVSGLFILFLVFAELRIKALNYLGIDFPELMKKRWEYRDEFIEYKFREKVILSLYRISRDLEKLAKECEGKISSESLYDILALASTTQELREEISKINLQEKEVQFKLRGYLEVANPTPEALRLCKTLKSSLQELLWLSRAGELLGVSKSIKYEVSVKVRIK